MGKLLSLGPKLKYPITISKLCKRPGNEIKKEEVILQYSYTYTRKVGDPFGEEWDEEQTTIADFDSPVDGSLTQWKVKEGQIITRSQAFAEVVETCSHEVQYAGLCGMCGKDMTEVSWATGAADTSRAKINMIHDQTQLTVSQDEAWRAEGKLQRRLLKHRKLSLVVDLDQTIIHACIDPTIGDWKADVNSLNHEALKEVRAFQLNEEGHRGQASSLNDCWYYIKMRPGLAGFLTKISELYELHIYTMGTRTYALNIAKLVDPDKKLFGDRIISRDENGNVHAKSLARLFPQNTNMVVIIDDRSDVWPADRPNLIKVSQFDFFKGVGDINSSFLPPIQTLPPVAPLLEAPVEESALTPKDETIVEPSDVDIIETPTGEAPVVDADAAKTIATPEKEVPTSPTPACSPVDEQTAEAEQEIFLEKQLNDRPLLHAQEKLDAEDANELINVKAINGETTKKHSVLKDDDDELIYLEKHLTQVHKVFYDEYESALVSAQGGRVAQLKPGHRKKMSLKEDSADLNIVPNIGNVMPRLKSQVLAGCVIVMSGLVPMEADLMRSDIAQQTEIFGARIRKQVTKKTTHVVASTIRTRTAKVRQAAKLPHIKIVSVEWLAKAFKTWTKPEETTYLVEIHPSDRKPDNGMETLPFESEIESEDSSSDEEHNPPSASQEIQNDEEGVMPDELEAGHSPVDDLKEFDWNTVDDELAEFMGDDDEDTESGNESDISASSRESSTKARVRTKRKIDETEEEPSDSDDGHSSMSKKQRIAEKRSTGLKTVKTPTSGSESGLPTPGITGDEDGLAEGQDDSSLDDELEAEMLAEFAREEAEAAASAGDGG